MKNRKKKIFAIHATIVITLAVLGYVVRKLFFDDMFSFREQIAAAIFSIVIISSLWFALNKIHATLNTKIPYSKGLSKRIFIQLSIGLTLFYTVLFLMMYIFIPIFMTVVITRQIVFSGVAVYFFINIAANSALIGYDFFTEWKNSLLLQEKLEKERNFAQFENLKNQLNPHFLFNSLSSLNSLIFENPELASKFLKQLSKVYRYLLENNENQPVTIETEINFVQNYIHLLQTRFDGGLEVNITIDDTGKQKKIIPVTLQILIENAIKHNSTFEDNPLIINIYIHHNYLVVKNNQQPKTRVEGSNKQGLSNLTSLYQYTTGSPAYIHNTQEHFIVEVPLID